MVHVSSVCVASVFVLALVFKSSAQEPEVRLSDIGGKRGRVEVLYNGKWGTVCRDGWGFFEALVVCKQLGFPWLSRLGWTHDAGNGTGPAWLSGVQCSGSEARLDECMHDGWREHQCTLNDYAAGVSCLTPDEFKDISFDAFLEDGEGVADDEGQMVLNLNTDNLFQRYLVCDQGWDMADATVLCRQRNRHSAQRATTGSYFGKPRLLPDSFLKYSYLATEFACTGNESHILECPAQAWFQDDCPSGHVAGVICNSIEEPEGFQLRLVNGSSPNEGRVEAYTNGTWGSICLFMRDPHLTYKETNVICQQLGLGYGLEAPVDDRFGRSAGPVAMSGDLVCAGSESSLAQCYLYEREPTQGCLDADSNHQVSVICSGPVPASRSPVRLSGVKYPENGLALIHHDGRWGTICNKNWTSANSQVVCRELGFGPPDPEKALPFPGAGPIFLGSVSCKGDEATLDQCKLGEWSQHDCDHSMDVNLHCTPSGAGSIVASAVLLLTTMVALFCIIEY